MISTGSTRLQTGTEMKAPLDKITIQGFKSIRSLEEFPLNHGLNIFIGANSAGKSNFVEFFRLMEKMALKDLNGYVAQFGGAETFFFQGSEVTEAITVELRFPDNGYYFQLHPTTTDKVLVGFERAFSKAEQEGLQFFKEDVILKPCTSKEGESMLFHGHSKPGGNSIELAVRQTIESWQVYHFQNTSPFSSLRKPASIHNQAELFPDGSNLSAFLWSLKQRNEASYEKIVNAVQFIFPAFEDFELKPEKLGDASDNRTVKLCWKQKGTRYVFQPWQMSDGTLRYLTLVTALMQPNPPSTIIIDEPELGLHPNALGFIAGLMHSVSHKTQLIVATQSPDLLKTMEPEDVVVVHNRDGESIFERLEREPLAAWIEEYSLSDLWLKNVIQAGPDHA